MSDEPISGIDGLPAAEPAARTGTRINFPLPRRRGFSTAPRPITEEIESFSLARITPPEAKTLLALNLFEVTFSKTENGLNFGDLKTALEHVAQNAEVTQTDRAALAGAGGMVQAFEDFEQDPRIKAFISAALALESTVTVSPRRA